MTLSTVYITLFLPYVKPAGNPERKESANKGLARLMGPTRMLLPQMWRLSDGHKQRQWGAPLLAFGVFLGVVRVNTVISLVNQLIGFFGQIARDRLYSYACADVCPEHFRIRPYQSELQL